MAKKAAAKTKEAEPEPQPIEAEEQDGITGSTGSGEDKTPDTAPDKTEDKGGANPLDVAGLLSEAAEQAKAIAGDIKSMTLPQLVAFLKLLYSIYGLLDPSRSLEMRVKRTVEDALDDVKAKALRRSDVLYAISWFNRRLNIGFADQAANARAQEGHNQAAALRASRLGGLGRALALAVLVPLGLTACVSIPTAVHKDFPLAITVTEGTEEFPEAQLAVEWPESIRRHEEIVTVQIQGRVISYGPLTEEDAARFREALGQESDD